MVCKISFCIFYYSDSQPGKLNCLPVCNSGFTFMFDFFNISPVDGLKWNIAHNIDLHVKSSFYYFKVKIIISARTKKMNNKPGDELSIVNTGLKILMKISTVA